jgi:hypothetical protein
MGKVTKRVQNRKKMKEKFIFLKKYQNRRRGDAGREEEKEAAA